MNIDFSNIMEVYGSDVLNSCKENVEDFVKNINYLSKLGFSSVEDIVERFPFLFLNEHSVFVAKINSLVKKLGINYIAILEDDMSYWEDLL